MSPFIPVSVQNSIDDELVISKARRCNKYTDKLVIFDARSMFAAGGNMLKVCCSLMQSPLYFETKNDVSKEIESAFHISEGGQAPLEV